CGIEDTTMYFQEPKNLAYNEATFTISFDGYNQEEDDDEYLFVGYDVYYYFNDDSGSALKAAVRIPKQSETRFELDPNIHTPLFNFVGVDSSFSNYSVNDLDIIYQDVTFPVTEEMIDDVLEEGKSDNVRLCFDRPAVIGTENPKKVSNDHIYLEELFPKYEQYKSQIEASNWGDIDEFWGFLDIDYYNYYSYTPYQTIGSDNYYKMKIFVIAKGFNSNTERNKGDYIESLKSSVREISIRVDQATLNP
ncbi:MAG: hypothetical protein JXA99_15215, partial [Candidatus Lokiarchaeota archaeon]|nr:hypothetical protein [Candidatus Lokiarchaeota archaeon]